MNVLKRALGRGKRSDKAARQAAAEWESDDDEPPRRPSVSDVGAAFDNAHCTLVTEAGPVQKGAQGPPAVEKQVPPPPVAVDLPESSASLLSAEPAPSPTAAAGVPPPTSSEENGRVYRIGYGDAGKKPITPLNLLPYSTDGAARHGGDGGGSAPADAAQVREKEEKIRACLSVGDVETLRQVCWSGIPTSVRPVCWMTLTNYVSSTHAPRRATELVDKREVYQRYVEKHYNRGDRDGGDAASKAAMSIILKDAPRTMSKIPFFAVPQIQQSLVRILYTWAVRHPATGYVQGMNDMLTPFLFVYYSAYVGADALMGEDAAAHVAALSADVVENVEGDVFWGFTALVQNIQDHFTEGQVGIQSKLAALQDLLRKVNPQLHHHLEAQRVAMADFGFKWVACLFLRELPLRPLLRLWDTYLAEGCYEYPRLHVYVCLALLQRFSSELLALEFCDLVPFLLAPPTDAFTELDVSELLSKAYCLQQLYPLSV
eukprot:TRINITY_DN27817_c0_g1_i1.p1 TRINITY_DN27817_c0_g1~~TRINITY_DN27817_c0_g1_i1.p1  ORF type:complete len:487 (+),score=178.09 TRINITY_DN27817_c0_g1_i1:156-1616(+)